MSAENPFGQAPAQEQGEMKDPRQEATDTLFEIRATKNLNDEDRNIHDREREAMGALLSGEMSQKFGELYKVGEEESNFYLAQRENASSGWEFDPKNTLGIFTDEQLDLAEGKVRVSYDIRAMSKERDGWSPRYFDTTMAEDVHIEFSASPEARKRVYDTLEADYQDLLKRYEQDQKDFQEFKQWADQNLKKSFSASDWEKYPLLDKLFVGVACKTFDVYRDETPDGQERYNMTFIGEDGHIADIMSRVDPKHPERNFPPRKSET